VSDLFLVRAKAMHDLDNYLHVCEQTIDLINKLRKRIPVTASEIPIIASWAGNGKGDFYDLYIIDAYRLKHGENTWRNLAALLRKRQP
jgi:hypothetical protein